MKNKKGFTLIELVVVVAILGILLLFIFPAVGNAKQKAQEVAFDMTRRKLHEAAIMFTIDFPNTEVTWASHTAGHIANKDVEITDDNLHEAWFLYLDEYPQDPTREKGSSFIVEIFKNGDIEIYPEELGR